MFNLLNECSDFELLKANLSMEQLCSIETILNDCGECPEPGANEAFYNLVVDWFTGNIDAEKLIEGILSVDNSNDSILDMFESVEIKNNSRLSDEDADFCMRQQALYEKVHAHYTEMYTRLRALQQFDAEFYEAVSEDNVYPSGSNNKIYRNEFFTIGEEDFKELIINVHNIFIKQINCFFRDKYKITVEDKSAITYLGVKKPKKPELPDGYFRATAEVKAAYKTKLEEHKAAYKQYVANITSIKLHYDCVVDDIFLLLGAFTFEEQAEKEIKDSVFNAIKRSYEIRSRKIAFNILPSNKNYNEYEVSLDRDNYKSLLRALTYFDSAKRHVEIYNGWVDKFIASKKKENDGIYETHSTDGSKVISFRYYKNGKFEVEFTNHKTALEFANEFLGHREGAA